MACADSNWTSGKAFSCPHPRSLHSLGVPYTWRRCPSRTAWPAAASCTLQAAPVSSCWPGCGVQGSGRRVTGRALFQGSTQGCKSAPATEACMRGGQRAGCLPAMPPTCSSAQTASVGLTEGGRQRVLLHAEGGGLHQHVLDHLKALGSACSHRACAAKQLPGSLHPGSAPNTSRHTGRLTHSHSMCVCSHSVRQQAHDLLYACARLLAAGHAGHAATQAAPRCASAGAR